MLMLTAPDRHLPAPAPPPTAPGVCADAPCEAAEPQTTGRPVEQVLQSEVISALSYALDLTENAVPGHAVRCCMLAMRIGQALGLTDADLRDLYDGTLLKDVGCSSSVRGCEMPGGDDRGTGRAAKVAGRTRLSLHALRAFPRHLLPGANPGRASLRVVKRGMERHENRLSLIQARCDRGAAILRKLGLSEGCAAAVCALDEHWDGNGYPKQLRGGAIPMLARIMAVAQQLDIFACEFGREGAVECLRERSGREFDPALVMTAERLHVSEGLWTDGGAARERELLQLVKPGTAFVLNEAQIPSVLEAFADVLRAKSTFTYHHTLGVTDAATGVARHLGLPEWSVRDLYRAALVHDLGKLGVPNAILDKPGKLDASEWKIMREHPKHTQEILSQVPAFQEIAKIAGRHHERLDGSGYPYQLRAEQLSLHDRILAVADVYGALAEDRPYRKGLPPARILEMMGEDVPGKLDERCFGALICYMQEIKPFTVAA